MYQVAARRNMEQLKIGRPQWLPGVVYIAVQKEKKERTNWAVDGKEKKSEKVASLRGYREEKKTATFIPALRLKISSLARSLSGSLLKKNIWAVVSLLVEYVLG